MIIMTIHHPTTRLLDPLPTNRLTKLARPQSLFAITKHPQLETSPAHFIPTERPMRVEIALDPSTLVSLASRVGPARGANGATTQTARRGGRGGGGGARGGRAARAKPKTAEELDADMAVSCECHQDCWLMGRRTRILRERGGLRKWLWTAKRKWNTLWLFEWCLLNDAYE